MYALFTVREHVFKEERRELTKEERALAVIFKEQLCIFQVLENHVTHPVKRSGPTENKPPSFPPSQESLPAFQSKANCYPFSLQKSFINHCTGTTESAVTTRLQVYISSWQEWEYPLTWLWWSSSTHSSVEPPRQNPRADFHTCLGPLKYFSF